MQINNPSLPTASAQANPADPATTTSVTGVMMGIGSVSVITPMATGKINIVVSGDIDNSGAGNGAQVQIRYGTGAAPANGTALTGTVLGGLVKIVNGNVTGLLGLVLTVGRNSFSLNGYIPDLIIGTAYWIDISLASITAGTSRVRDLSVSIIESTT